VVAEQPPSGDQLRQALEVVAYELQRRADLYRIADPIAALEQVHRAASALPPVGSPLRVSYPALVELATRALLALATMPAPNEVDGLTDFGGFELWRQQR